MDEFHRIIEELLLLTDDQKELHFWEEIFADLSPDEQERVLQNLKAELRSRKQLRDEGKA